MGTITKALELLNFFSREAPALGLGDFVRLSGRDKATVHRHLVELTQNGFLEQHPTSRTYRLGPAVLRLSAVREATSPTRTIVRPLVEALAREVGELVHFSLLDGLRLSPVFHFDPAMHGTQVHFDEAEMLPLHATSSGIAVLAFSPDPLMATVLEHPLAAYTDLTVTSPVALSRLVATAAETGIATVDQGFDREVSSRAAPIFGATGVPIGAMAIAVPTSRATPDSIALHTAALRKTAPRVSAALGGTVPDTYPQT